MKSKVQQNKITIDVDLAKMDDVKKDVLFTILGVDAYCKTVDNMSVTYTEHINIPNIYRRKVIGRYLNDATNEYRAYITRKPTINTIGIVVDVEDNNLIVAEHKMEKLTYKEALKYAKIQYMIDSYKESALIPKRYIPNKDELRNAMVFLRILHPNFTGAIISSTHTLANNESIVDCLYLCSSGWFIDRSRVNEVEYVQYFYKVPIKSLEPPISHLLSNE